MPTPPAGKPPAGKPKRTPKKVTKAAEKPEVITQVIKEEIQVPVEPPLNKLELHPKVAGGAAVGGAAYIIMVGGKALGDAIGVNIDIPAPVAEAIVLVAAFIGAYWTKSEGRTA